MKYLASAAAALVLVSSSVHSEPVNPMLAQLGQLGGAVEAAVTACKIDVDVDMQTAKREQQEQFIQMGGTREGFEAAYKAGYDRARAEFDGASSADRKRMCDEFSNFASQGVPLP